MQTVLIMIHLMVVIALIGFVLLQRSEGGGLGSGGSSGGAGFLSSRGTANVLTRTTAFLALAFFASSLILSAIAGMDRKPASILKGASGTSAPISGGQTPEAPLSGGDGLLDTLRGGAPAQPPASPAPSGPQVPQSR